MPADDHVQESMLSEALAEVAIADTKASILLAALGIGFGSVFGGFLEGDWDPSLLGRAASVVWWLGAVLALCSVGTAAYSLWPRYRRNRRPAEVYYWGHVTGFENFQAFVSNLEASTITAKERVQHQLWHVSKVVNRKYTLIRVALLLAGVASAIFVLIGIVEAFEANNALTR